MRPLNVIGLLMSVLLLGSVQAAAMEELAQQRCRVLYQLIERFLPDRGRKAAAPHGKDWVAQTGLEAISMLRQLEVFIRAEANARQSQPSSTASASPNALRLRELPDGVSWRYRAGEVTNEAIGEHTDPFGQRLNRIISLLATPESAENVTVAFQSDLVQIRELLSRSSFVANRSLTPTRRVVGGTVLGGIMGAAVAPIELLISILVQQGKQQKRLVEEAHRDAAKTKDEHRRRLLALRDPRFPDAMLTEKAIEENQVALAVLKHQRKQAHNSESRNLSPSEIEVHERDLIRLAREIRKKEQELAFQELEREKHTAIQEHLQWVDQQEASGKTLTFGGRPHEYSDLTRVRYLADALKQIALAPLASTAEVHAPKQRRIESETLGNRFTEEELATINGLTESGTVLGFVGREAVGVASGLATGLAVSSNFPRIKARVVGPPVPPAPELAELHEALLKRDAPKALDWIWLGAHTHDGRHTDLILKVDRGKNPPAFALLGLEYRTPLDYLRPEDLKQSKEASEQVLQQLRLSLIAERFGRTFGEDLVPLNQAFDLAIKLELTESEMARLKAEVAKVTDKASLPRLLAFVRGLRR